MPLEVPSVGGGLPREEDRAVHLPHPRHSRRGRALRPARALTLHEPQSVPSVRDPGRTALFACFRAERRSF